MSSRESVPLPVRVFGALLLSPFYIVYGGVLIVRAVLRIRRAASGVRGALSATLTCPNGHRNEAVGRWRCAACGGVYHGWVGRCGLCGGGAGWMTCETCGVGVRLPWARR